MGREVLFLEWNIKTIELKEEEKIVLPKKRGREKEKRKGEQSGVAIRLKICLTFTATMEGRKKSWPLAYLDRISWDAATSHDLFQSNSRWVRHRS